MSFSWMFIARLCRFRLLAALLVWEWARVTFLRSFESLEAIGGKWSVLNRVSVWLAVSISKGSSIEGRYFLSKFTAFLLVFYTVSSLPLSFVASI